MAAVTLINQSTNVATGSRQSERIIEETPVVVSVFGKSEIQTHKRREGTLIIARHAGEITGTHGVLILAKGQSSDSVLEGVETFLSVRCDGVGATFKYENGDSSEPSALQDQDKIDLSSLAYFSLYGAPRRIIMNKIGKGSGPYAACQPERGKECDGVLLRMAALTVVLAIGGVREIHAEGFLVDEGAGRSGCHAFNRVGEDAIEKIMPHSGWRLYRTPLVKRSRFAKARRVKLPAQPWGMPTWGQSTFKKTVKSSPNPICRRL